MRRWYCLQRFFDGESRFSASIITAKTRDEAWDIINESIATNNSEEWLMSKKEWNDLKKLIDKK